ncbi:hypothetical protein LMG28690_03903 [Paraburkholderia caffeinilytica]|nr:hypothetical protein LMG28690_03903 [Paraburkholderia caffeinilytica]
MACVAIGTSRSDLASDRRALRNAFQDYLVGMRSRLRRWHAHDVQSAHWSISFLVADEFPDDVERVKACLHAAGRAGADDEVVRVWSECSDNLCTSWLEFPDSDDDLLTVLLKYWSLCHGVAGRYVAKLVPMKDALGGMWLPFADDVTNSIGWRTGDELEVERQGDTLVLRRLATKTKEQWARFLCLRSHRVPRPSGPR